MPHTPTPTPWSIGESDQGGHFIKGNGQSFEVVCDIPESRQGDRESILRAVNCHEDLMESLRWTLKVLDKVEEFHPGTIHKYLSVAGEQRWKEARYFATKAEGRKS
jgi:hypothetical protein